MTATVTPGMYRSGLVDDVVAGDAGADAVGAKERD